MSNQPPAPLSTTLRPDMHGGEAPPPPPRDPRTLGGAAAAAQLSPQSSSGTATRRDLFERTGPIQLGGERSPGAVLGHLSGLRKSRTERAESLKLSKQLGIEQSLRQEAEEKAAALEAELRALRRRSMSGASGSPPMSPSSSPGAGASALEQALARSEYEDSLLTLPGEEEQLGFGGGGGGSSSSSGGGSGSAEERHLNDIFAEILTSERRYVHDLQVARLVYLQPLRIMAAVESAPSVLESHVIERLFGSWEQIIAVNREFLAVLDKAVRTGGRRGGTAGRMAAVNRAFLKFAPYFRMYASYCNAFPAAQQLLEGVRDGSVEGATSGGGSSGNAFVEFERECARTKDCEGLDLGSYLIKPVQRICKYPLFFKELKKALVAYGATDEDLAALEDASRSTSEIANTINEKSRRTENRAKLLSVVGRLDGHPNADGLIQPHRELVLGINCSVFTPPKFKHALPVQLLLCTDIALVCRRNHDSLDLRTATIEEVQHDRLRFAYQWDLGCLHVSASAPQQQEASQGSSGADGAGGSTGYRLSILITGSKEDGSHRKDGGSMKTTVDKYQLEFTNKQDCDLCRQVLQDVKSKWDEVEAAQESASATINKRSGRQERNWKSRARNNRLSGQFGTLDALKDRYKKRGSAAGGPAGVAGAAGGGGGAGTASASTMPATALERRASAEGRKAFAEALKAQKEQQSGNDIRV